MFNIWENNGRYAPIAVAGFVVNVTSLLRKFFDANVAFLAPALIGTAAPMHFAEYRVQYMWSTGTERE